MPAIELVRNYETGEQSAENPLPKILQTPLGLAIIEIQGTIHAPLAEDPGTDNNGEAMASTIHVGRLEFPLYDGSSAEGPWMKSVYLYVGKHQRLTGEIKKLAKPLMVLSTTKTDIQPALDSTEGQLGINAVIRHKILFSSRPEPVGG